MAVKKNGLGKGLDSLIPKSTIKTNAKNNEVGVKLEKEIKIEKVVETIVEEKIVYGEQMMKVSMVEPNREQPRKQFEEDSLLELADSLKQYGVLQPLLVQKKNDYYEIIAGERRWRAAKIAGLKEVPVIVKEYTEQEVVEIALIENIQRENLNPIEEAMAYKKLLNEYNLKQDEIAERVSKSRTAVTNTMRLLKLSDQVQQMIVDEMISTGHARALLAIEDETYQYQLAQKIFDEKLSVREVEKLIKELKKPIKEKVKEKSVENKFVYDDLENKMNQILGTKVNIKQKNNKGKIEIEYYSPEELEHIFDLLMSIKG
ncbi:MAG: ParB/RepB/Spo0J family partition protein [Eubacteriales bacterium]